ncbi:ATP GTP hydrolase [Ligilactobacillus hayakitensis DSM 18933 = JCM 14209]|uniref:tRNA threonylcarbamoyladenosine biosynthesis protein TsaE n=1 Tax=Ligilactobacillus hayakitensis DSM 18933 = JCM 14209 TaxID=1423755 RepID=A0A0R1WLJ0_9LACO|nr:tRNA (adenosine(37)-N6)-threonylcarbamoyltransferase complex ATPase subunit type 1 TsaE [Ligilactobacillus hayakitensis]KRM18365.1 ATP GTP hydrolase [Ligilactobacillus hayakitensis DSM 18933 = JCM 14209]
MKELIINNAEEMMELGKKLAQQVCSGDVLLLDGDLGAGKTTFTKGLALGLGIKRNIKSPTFTLIREYRDGKLPLYHMDMYRLEETGAGDIGLDDYFNGDGVCVIEWSQFIDDELPSQYLIMHILKDENDFDKRYVTLEARGDQYQKIIDNI